jgi:hypothetical protein
MAIAREHELHRRRRGRNLGVALCLLAFIVVLFGLSAAKVRSVGPTEGFDHVPRPQLDLRAQERESPQGGGTP